MKKNLTALLLGAALLLATAIPGLAADPGQPLIAANPDPAPITEGLMPDSLLYHGQLKAVNKDEAGTVTGLLLNSEQSQDYVMTVSPETVFVDNTTREAFDPAELTVGETLFVYHSPISTKSLPPQSPAFAVVRNPAQGADNAQYQLVLEVTQREDGRIAILTSNGGLYISADEKTGLGVYKSEDTLTLEQLRAGDRIMAWYSIVLTSYPGQTYASHILLLPRSAQEGDTLTLTLDGTDSQITGRFEDGVAMIPVAAVARTLGFDVTYTPAEKGALVTVDSDAYSVRLDFGQGFICGTPVPDGQGELTAPLDYGKEAYILAPGTTWAPARLFELLGKTVTLEGTCLTIR